jgi:predicted nucleic acid-binding protein
VIYTLDTNVLVDARRQPAELDRLKTFLTWALPSTVLKSIVAAGRYSRGRARAA